MWMTALLAALGGAAVGLVVGLLGKLTRGAYPLIARITESPYKSALLGAFVGIMIASWHGFLRSPRRVDTAGPVAQITSAEQFRTDVLDAARPVVVDFFATWCGPCKMLSPTLEDLAWEYAGRVSFVKVDVDQLGDLSRQYNVQGVPTVVLIRGGQEVHRWVGVQPAGAYRQALGALGPQTKPQ
ncbi:MAG: thioredoxin [Phycisphaerae bacterium]|nr:thioredoxin [Phycisphaerae bacterium]